MTMKRRIAILRTWIGWTVISASLVACGGDSSAPTPTVASVEVTPLTASPRVGQTVQLSATVKDAAGQIMSGQSVSWSSSAASVASVSAAGQVTANALGTAVISATSGTKSGTATITVAPEPIASISVAPGNDTLLIGETLQLTATMRDANNAVVTGRTPAWASSSPNIASVSGSGLVTGVGDGVTTVTASADGRSAAAILRVYSRCSTALAPNITVGQIINGSLAATDCTLSDTTYADGYAITVTASTNVQIDLTSGAFDAYLFLLELTTNGIELLAEHDDIDPDDPANPSDPIDTNSRITFTLLPGHQYFILANAFTPRAIGDYQLKVSAVTPFVAARILAVQKAGKAPASTLLKALKRP
jgi:uncharacterized protein YjdB